MLGADAHDSKKIISSDEIKRKAEVSTTNLREVFNDCCGNSDGASCVNFKKLESSMVKRRLLQPKIPSSALEFGSLPRESKYSTNNLKTVIAIDDDQVAVIFVSSCMLNLLKGSTNIQFDGTFHVVPTISLQLLQYSLMFTIMLFQHCIF